MEFEKLLWRYSDFLAGQGLDVNERRRYEERAEHYLAWLSQQRLGDRTDPTLLERYVQYLRQQGCGPEVVTVARRAIGVLRSLR